MKKALLLGYISALVSGQQIVTSIEYHGNDITRDYIISRELQHKTGVPLDSALVEGDVNRLLNLGIFNDVRWMLSPGEDSTWTLRYIFHETWRYLPIIAPQYREESGWSLLLGGAINNYMGRNQSLVINLSLGGLDAYGVAFSDPWILGDHISFYGDIWHRQYPHIFLPYTLEESFTNFNFGRYFGYSKRLKLGAEFIKRKFLGDQESHVLTYFSPLISYTFDTRDVYSSPTNGWVARWTFDGKFGKDVSYSKINQSYAWFHPIRKGDKPLVIGLNGLLSISPGTIPEPVEEYLGGAYTVRGWSIPNSDLYNSGSYSYRFGNHYWLSSIELRQTIVPRQSPAPGLEYGLEAGVFIDAGGIAYTIDHLPNEEPLFGCGVGLRIPMAGYESIRIDYGFSYYKGEWIESALYVAFGQKF